MKQHYTQGRELAAKGRHGDTMLLHVSPKEVHGLASLGALTGRRVTINPTTGLPEAFDFSSLLPTLAAIGVSLIPGGAPFAPLAAAATAGATTAVKGGDMTDIMKSAGMAGVGTWAGGELATGLGGLGAPGTAGAAPGAFPTVAGVEAAAKLAATPAEAAAAWGSFPGDPVPSTVAAATPAAAVAPGAAAAPQTFAGNIDAFGTKVGNIGRALTGNTSEAFKYLGQHPFLVAGAAAPMLFGGYTPDDTKGDKDDERPRRPGFGAMMPPQVKSFPGADYNPNSGDWNYYPRPPPPAPPVTPTAGNYFASGGGSVPSGLRAMPARRMASGGESGTYLDALRRPYGESPYVPMADYTPSYVASSTGRKAPGDTSDAPAPAAPVSDGDGGGGGDAGGAMAAGGLIPLRKAAGGRAADNSDHFGMTAGLMAEARAALLGEHDDPRRALARFESVFGGEALQILRDKIGGGRIRGAGGGLDDLIPGTIEGKQRVRLADGEFVVPADVVSGIGDGSTDQGVRKLHEMMTNVRGERTGKRTQPKRLREGALIV